MEDPHPERSVMEKIHKANNFLAITFPIGSRDKLQILCHSFEQNQTTNPTPHNFSEISQSSPATSSLSSF
jgi:hypothetical protein